MKKYRKYFLNPNRNKLVCDVYINNKYCISFSRDLENFAVAAYRSSSQIDVTTFDLELHAFLRLSHQYIIDANCLEVKIEEMFNLENPNLV